MSCPCDHWTYPPTLQIGAGLATIPRQLAGFSEFRRAMFASLDRHSALSGWRCQEEDNLGVMLIEMWAYVCDILAFYDQVIAQEAYLRTARRRASLRKLVGRLGYLPRPAVAATVTLAAIADGRRPVHLAVGTAFRSQGFDGEPPQVFELDQETAIHPLTNSWALEASRPTTFGDGHATPPKRSATTRDPLFYPRQSSSLFALALFPGNGFSRDVPAATRRTYFLLKPETAELDVGDPFLVRVAETARTEIRTVTKVAPFQDAEGSSYTKVEFTPVIKLAPATALTAIGLTKPTQRAALWTLRPDSGAAVPAIMDGSQLVLDGLYRQIRPGDLVLVAKGGDYRWFEVLKMEETMQLITEATRVPATDAAGKPILGKDDEAIYCPIPAVRSPATKLFLDADLNNQTRKAAGALNWTNDDAGEITVHYGLVTVGEVTEAARAAVSGETALSLASSPTKPIETPPEEVEPKRFLVLDKDGVGQEVSGAIDFGQRGLQLDRPLVGSLRPPLKILGNLIQASRGESVHGEILGSGNAALVGQTFKLKKKPLTYLAAPTAADPRGVSSTLRVWVGGLRWQEVPSFFGQGPEAAVYIVRRNDAGETLVIFGDGRRGRRLPTGINNLLASYRFGAGAKAPPAGSITQVAKPVKGLASIQNPCPAAGGADAERRDELRDRAPRSALILGRAVSILDFEAVAGSVAGVRAARAEWRWNPFRQRPVVQVWYIGAEDLAPAVSGTLRHLSDSALPLDVRLAEPVPLRLSLDIEIEPRYREEVVLTDVRQTLMDPEAGLLAPERIGIGRPLYRSRLFAQVLALPGPTTVRDIQWDGNAFEGFAISPGGGRYFDLEGGKLILNGREDFSG